MNTFRLEPGAVRITLSKPNVLVHIRQGDYDKADVIVKYAGEDAVPLGLMTADELIIALGKIKDAS